MTQDDTNADDVKGAPDVREVYDRLCQLQRILDRQREMMRDPWDDDQKPFVKLADTDATVEDEDGNSRALTESLRGRIRDPDDIEEQEHS